MRLAAGVEEARMLARAVDLIEAARRGAGITQRDLARRLGVGDSRVSQVLTGHRKNVTLRTVARFAAAVGIRLQIEAVST